MKIVWILPNLHITGGTRAAIELSSRIAAMGAEATLVVPEGRCKVPIPSAVKVIEVGWNVGNPLLAVPVTMLALLFRIPKVDLMLASMPPYALIAHWMGKRRGIPSLNYVLNDDVHFFDDRTHLRSRFIVRLYRYVARQSIKAGPLIVNSHWTGVKTIQSGGNRPSGIVPSGYDPDIFFPPQEARSNRPLRVLYLARKERWKGLDDFAHCLDAFASKPKQSPHRLSVDDGNIRNDGEERNGSIISREMMGNGFDLTIVTQEDLDFSRFRYPFNLCHPGNDIELADLYRQADIFVHNSHFEGFGLPPLEAMACGCAVVATDSGGVREFLRDSENCLMVSPREPASLAHSLSRLLNDSELRQRLAAQGTMDAVTFTWDKCAEQMRDIITRIIGHPPCN